MLLSAADVTCVVDSLNRQTVCAVGSGHRLPAADVTSVVGFLN